MAEIIYRPTCSKCGHLLPSNNVGYAIVTLEGGFPRECICIKPCQCPRCNEPFTHIIIDPPSKEEY